MALTGYPSEMERKYKKQKSLWCILGFHDWEFVCPPSPNSYRCRKCGEWEFDKMTPRVI